MATPRAKLHIQFSKLVSLPFRSLFHSRSDLETKFLARFKELCHITDKSLAVGSSCRSAVYTIIKSLELTPNSLIALTPLTIPDIVNAIILAGHRPYFVELDKDTHSINCEEIDKLKDVKVIILAHLSGIFNERIIKNIQTLKDRGIFVIEDISQAYASCANGVYAGGPGHAFVGSFCLGKVISSIGGGVWGIQDPRLYTQVKMLQSELAAKKLTPSWHFLKYYLQHLKISLLTQDLIFNILTIHLLRIVSAFKNTNEVFRSPVRKENYPYDNPSIKRTSFPPSFFSLLRCSQLLCGLDTLHTLHNGIKRRNKIKEKYLETLGNSPYLPNALLENNINTLWHFPINATHKDYLHIQKALLEKNIDSCGYLLRNCNELECFSEYRRELPVLKSIEDNTLFIPIHESFGDSQTSHILKVFKELL